MKMILSTLFCLLTAISCLAGTSGDIQITCEPGARIWLDNVFKGKSSADENGLFISRALLTSSTSKR